MCEAEGVCVCEAEGVSEVHCVRLKVCEAHCVCRLKVSEAHCV